VHMRDGVIHRETNGRGEEAAAAPVAPVVEERVPVLA
jgi:hypothetical protein